MDLQRQKRNYMKLLYCLKVKRNLTDNLIKGMVSGPDQEGMAKPSKVDSALFVSFPPRIQYGVNSSGNPLIHAGYGLPRVRE
jgi:hypothetical protein